MSSYIRKLSYLYYYENNEKGANSGYAKLERREGVIRFQVNIRYRTMDNIVPVLYFYVKPEGGKWTLIPMGRCKVQNHQITMGFTKMEEEIFPAGIKVEDIQGILLPLRETRCFASSWNDREASEYFWLMDWIDINGNVMGAEENPAETEESYREENEGGEEIEENYVERNKNGAENNEKFMDGNRSFKEEYPGGMEASPEYEVNAAGKEKIKTMEWASPEYLRDWIPIREEKITPELVFSVYPSLPEFLSCKKCIRIEPQDIGILPMESWFLASNSFLLHGYYNFNHLLLGWKTEKPEAFVLGVPGIYDQRERVMAGMFGFEAFEVMGRKDGDDSGVPEGTMGYWYRFIEPSLRQENR